MDVGYGLGVVYMCWSGSLKIITLVDDNLRVDLGVFSLLYIYIYIKCIYSNNNTQGEGAAGG